MTEKRCYVISNEDILAFNECINHDDQCVDLEFQPKIVRFFHAIGHLAIDLVNGDIETLRIDQSFGKPWIDDRGLRIPLSAELANLHHQLKLRYDIYIDTPDLNNSISAHAHLGGETKKKQKNITAGIRLCEVRNENTRMHEVYAQIHGEDKGNVPIDSITQKQWNGYGKIVVAALSRFEPEQLQKPSLEKASLVYTMAYEQ